MLHINEVFYSIQGEGNRTGYPCVFIRLTACHLRCSWCDTKSSYYEGEMKSNEEIILKIKSYQCNLVCITGGEPLLQGEVFPLIDALVALGYEVELETSGSILIDKVNKKATKIVDVKTPNSGAANTFNLENIQFLNMRDQLKFVILNRNDYDWSKDFILKHQLVQRGNILFSPVHQILSLKELAAWVLEDRLPIKLQMQFHKYIGVP